jgi:hypothetical protein
MLWSSTMHLDRRLLASLCCAGWLVAGHAKAQPGPAPAPGSTAPAPAATPGPAPAASSAAPEAAPAAPASPDTLETPYADTPPSAPPRAPAPASKPQKIELTVPKPDIRPQLPIRARRKLAILGEIAWNGLAGFGPILTYNVHPNFSVDFGAGFSLLGGKLGVRGRYNFLTTPFTPFVGLGYNYGSGFGQFPTNPKDDPNGDPNREPATIDHGPSHLIQSVVGFDFIHRRGFTMLGTVGYAWLLNHDNYKVLAGTLTHDEKQGFDIAFKGGLVLGVAMGYAFETN